MLASSLLRAQGGGTLVGTLPGEFSVDNKGAANCTIPLKIAPGRGGMEPKLALVYNSGSDNGPLGVGWSLSTGFPQAITRGRSILARDGVVRGTNFDANDKFYLDGKRLIVVSGTYGQPGSIYRTEVDSFVTITAAGTGGNIEYFTLADKDGVTMTFGKYAATTDGYQVGAYDANNDGVIDPGEVDTLAFAWALKHVEDSLGRTCEFSYENADAGEWVISRIDYTGSAPAARVLFTYNTSVISGTTARLDKTVRNIAKRRFDRARRLEQVTAQNDAGSGLADMARYQLQYTYAPNHGRTRLIGIAPSFRDPSTGSFNSIGNTSFVWSDDAMQWSGVTAYNLPSDPNNLYHPFAFGDFDGDGKEDYIDARGGFTVYRANGTGYEGGVTWMSGGVLPAGYMGSIFVADINGDGKKDLVFADRYFHNLYAVLSTGTGFVGLDGGNSPTLICNTGETFQDPPFYTGEVLRTTEDSAMASRVVVADFTGDGRDDVLLHGYNGYLYLIRSNGTSFVAPQKSSHQGNSCVVAPNYDWTLEFTGYSIPEHYTVNPMPCDVNGDGMTDYVWVEVDRTSSPSQYFYASIKSLYVAIALPNGDFTAPVAIDSQVAASTGNPPHISYDDVAYAVLPGDYNGDGLTDFLVLSNKNIQNQRWLLLLNRGGGSDGYPSFELVAGPIPNTITANGETDWTHFPDVTASAWINWNLNQPIPPNWQHPDRAALFAAIESSSGENMFALDVNNDGITDFVWYVWAGTDEVSTVNRGWWVLFGKGDGSFGSPTRLTGTPWSTVSGAPANNYPQFNSTMFANRGDVNGDGMEDLTISTGVNGRNMGLAGVAYRQGARGDLITGMADGLGRTTTIAYMAAKDSSIYTPGAAVSYPIREWRASTPVVSDLWKDSGGSTSAQFSYQYSGNRLDVSGRGSLGFHSFVTLDRQTNLFKYQFLTQSFPMTGLAAREETYRSLGAGAFYIISSHDNTVVFDKVVKSATDSTPWGTLYPFISRATEYRWEDGAKSFSISDSEPSTKPEGLFGVKDRSGAHIVVTAESLFDQQGSVVSSLPSLPAGMLAYKPSDTDSSGTSNVNVVGGSKNDTELAVLMSDLSGQITYGNLKRLTTDYDPINHPGQTTEIVAKTYYSPVGSLTGLVNTITTTVNAPVGGSLVAPIKSYTYFTTPGGTPTPLIATETVDGTQVAGGTQNLYFKTTYGYNAGRVSSKVIYSPDPSIGTYQSYGASAWDSHTDQPTNETNAAPYQWTTVTAYDLLLGLPVSVTDVNGAQVTNAYDALGRTVQVTDVLKGLTTSNSFALDSTQTVAGPVGVNGVATGAPITGVVGLSLTSVYKVVTTTTVKPSVTSYYDRLGRVIRTIKSGFNNKQIYTDTAYNNLGQVIATSLPYDHGDPTTGPFWTTTTYDALGRVVSVTVPNGTTTTNTYFGRATKTKVVASGVGWGTQTNSVLVDAKGRTVSVWNANNEPTFSDNLGSTGTTASICYALDGFGRMVTTTLLGQTQAITASYDAFGHETQLADPDKGTWNYVSNVLGQVLTQTDAKLNQTTSTFDHLGRPLTRVTTSLGSTGDGSTETAGFYYYDLADNPSLNLVAKGAQGWIGSPERDESATTYAAGYPAPGYVAPKTSTIHYYDAKGRPFIDLASLDGKYFYTYTDYAEPGGNDYSRVNHIRHFWRPADNQDESKMPYRWQDFGYAYTYDTQSYLLSVSDSLGRTWWAADSTNGYDYLDRPAVVLKGLLAGSGPVTTHTYNPLDGTLTGIVTSGSVQNLSFTYDGLGNLHTRTDNLHTGTSETCTYDNLNRLINSTKQGATTYFDNGNISSKNDVSGNPVASYAYGGSRPHAVTSVTTSGSAVTFGYDLNGNLLTRTKTGESWNMRWAGFDKPRWMTKTTTSPAATVGSEFNYNAARSRVMQLEFDALSGGVPSHYTHKRIYALGSTLEINYDNQAASGAPTWQLKKVRIYVPGPDGVIGAREFDPTLAPAQQEKALLYHYDHLGSVQVITPAFSSSYSPALDDTGKPGLYSEDAWGQRRDPNSWSGAPSTTDQGGHTSVSPCGFTGHEMLDDLGLVHMNGRIYDPLLGRFLSADLLVQNPGSLQSYNRYSYVQNNPLTLVDPTGWYSVLGLEFTDGGGVGGFFSDLADYGKSAASGANGGAEVYANAISFGATDATGISHSSQFSGSEYTGSRLAGMVGSTAVAVATGGAAAGGNAVAQVGIAAISGKVAGDSAVDVGQGTAKIVNDPKSAEGYAQAASGVVGLAATAVSVKAANVEQVASEAPKTGSTSEVKAKSPTAEATEKAGPSEPYNRKAHYGDTPTAADRKALGAGSGQVVNHEPPLVKRYYEGDLAKGEKPGYQMIGAERKASGSDRSRMDLQSKSDSNKQGGEMSKYSKDKKKELLNGDN